MKIVMVGQGAFAKKHLNGLKNIKDVEVASIFGRTAESTEAVAKQYGIPHWTTNMEEALDQPGVETGKHYANGMMGLEKYQDNSIK